MESKASLVLEVVDLDAYRAAVKAAARDTEKLVAAQEKASAGARDTSTAFREGAVALQQSADAAKAETTAIKAQTAARKQAEVATRKGTDAEKELQKAWWASLAPHEKTAERIKQVSALHVEEAHLVEMKAKTIASLNALYEDQHRRMEMNRGSQNKLSRSLAELLDEQTKAQTAAIAAGAALIKEGLSSDKLSVAIAHLSATTADADKKSEAYRAEVAKLEGQLREVTAAEKAQSAAQREAAEHYDLTKKRLDAVETAMEGLRLPGAEIVTSFKRLSDAMETANKTLTVSQVRMLKAAIAIGAVGAAGTAAVVGVAALGAAVIANSAAADDWNHDLAALGLNLDKVGTEQVNRAAAAIDTVGQVSKAAGVAIAETLGPAVEQGGTRLVALGLMAIDAWKNFAAGKEPLTLIAEIVGKGLTLAFDTLVSPIKNVALGLALLLDTAGVTEDAAARLNAGFREFSDTMSERAAAAIEEYANEKLPELIAATDDYMGRASELVGKQTAINQATREGAAAAEAAAAAWELYGNKAVAANADILKSAQGTAAGTAGASATAAKAQKADIDEVKEAAIQALEQEADMKAAQIAYGLRLAQSAADASIALIEMVGGESRRSAIAALAIQKATALASIAISTAESIAKGIALFGPPPSPAGIAAIIAASAIGAAQAAVVVGSAIGSFSSAAGTGGGASPSAGSSGGGGSVPSVGGGQNVPTASAVGMGGGTGNGGRPTAQLAIPSSDGYFPPTMGGRTIQTAPGDEAWVQRGGALNRANQTGNGDVLAPLVRALLTEIKGLRQDLTVQRLIAARTGPARSY